MRLTSSFVVFRADPEDRDLASARWLAREGRHADALAIADDAVRHFGPDAAMPLAPL